jgi:hypothetical protein
MDSLMEARAAPRQGRSKRPPRRINPHLGGGPGATHHHADGHESTVAASSHHKHSLLIKNIHWNERAHG